MPAVFDLIAVPRIKASGKLNPGRRLEERLRANESVSDHVVRVGYRCLRVEESATFGEAAAAECLRVDGARAGECEHRARNEPHCRRMAWSVNPSGFSGTSYSSFSSESRVLLPRRKSAISIVRPVQIPCTCWMSL